MAVMVDGAIDVNKDYWRRLWLSSIPPESVFLLNAYLSLKMSPWVPQQAGLQEILQTIHESTTTSATVQRSITEVRPFDPIASELINWLYIW